MNFNNSSSSTKPAISSHSTSTLDPWCGESKIVVGIDIGNTKSVVSYAYLQMGVEPTIHYVRGWPGQELESRDRQNSVPTRIWYDESGKAMSFGAETLTNVIRDKAEDNNWFLAKGFKLHLYPDTSRTEHNLRPDVALPFGVPLSQLYKDFLGYLFQQTKTEFERHIFDGEQIWARYSSAMEVILAHPSGWGIRQQEFLQTATVEAGWLSRIDSADKLWFITEAEASVQFCKHYSNAQSLIQTGTHFAVCDAGGSTVATGLYLVETTHPFLRLSEVRKAVCVQTGGIAVDKQAESYLYRLLGSTGIPMEDRIEYTSEGVKDFETRVKQDFHDAAEISYIGVGNPRLHHPDLGIRRGRINLTGAVVRLFFDQCVGTIVSSVHSQLSAVSVPYILLVGGFGNNPHLLKQMKAWFEPLGTQVIRPNESSTNTVAGGTLLSYRTLQIVRYTPRYSVGFEDTVILDPNDEEHRARITYTREDGVSYISGRWVQIVQKGVTLDPKRIYRHSYTREYQTPNPDLSTLEVSLYAYTLDGRPQWLRSSTDTILDGFQVLAIAMADLGCAQASLQPSINSRGGVHWTFTFNICVKFSGRELSAFIEWVDLNDSKIRRGPVSIIPRVHP